MFGALLLAEDDPLQRAAVSMLLKNRLSYEVVAVENGADAVARVSAEAPGAFSAVILDVHMPVMDGFEALQKIRQLRPETPVIMLTADEDVATAVKAVKLGATDYLTKPIDVLAIEKTIKNAVKIGSLTREVSRLKREQGGAISFEDMIGHDGGLARAVNFGRKAAASDVPVLITGETGTGKELFARAIHGESHRTGKPFVAVNCGAIPKDLIESLLFGHEKGSFTGAIARTVGKFREAEGGSIFLDEVGEMPLDAQVKLLRAIQEKEVEPVGSSKTFPTDVRIISATNRDLKKEIENKRFREDLFFRLNVLPVTLPSLRERPHDIVPLSHFFMERFQSTTDKKTKVLSVEAERYLTEYNWRGNVRELENLIHRLIVLCDGTEISAEYISEQLQDKSSRSTAAMPGTSKPMGIDTISLYKPNGSSKTIVEIEAEAIRLALNLHGNQAGKAAEMLGMAKSTFYRKLKEYNISQETL